ncbi:MAG: histidinol dehydrogenase [Deltaproteobacteria bacterium]|nr:histidinol dehydrogenase [Deltaproteobacteria bacterium]
MKTLRSSDRNFRYEFEKILKRGEDLTKDVYREVINILEEVKLRGDKAVQKYTKKFDRFELETNRMLVTKAEIKKAYKEVPKEHQEALQLAAKRIEAYHKKQKYPAVEIKSEGIRVGQRVTPLKRVGVYVPGGKAAYPSTVLMNALPARVAGVEEVVIATPFVGGECSPAVLVAADIAGVDTIYKMGGAQAIGAFAYGTGQIKRVDKIVGPGNAYVAQAKREVFGLVDVDMIAGPSEVLIIADQDARPDWVAADMLSQAEHDENAVSVLVTFNSNYAHRVEGEIRRQLRFLSRRKIAEASIKNKSFIIVAKDIKEGIELSNEIAPEHLELAVQDPEKYLPEVHNAGAIFLGLMTPEVCGDYIAGPSHVLPTAGNARFGSPLSVLDFLKTSSVISFDEKALRKFAPTLETLSQMEGLDAHGLAIKVRLEEPKPSERELRRAQAKAVKKKA